MYTVRYIDNQSIKRTFKARGARCFGEAVTRAENYANEQGHGVKVIGAKRERELFNGTLEALSSLTIRGNG